MSSATSVPGRWRRCRAANSVRPMARVGHHQRHTALAHRLAEHRAEHGVLLGGVRADEEDRGSATFHERVAHGDGAVGHGQARDRGGVAQARAMIHVVRAQHLARELSAGGSLVLTPPCWTRAASPAGPARPSVPRARRRTETRCSRVTMRPSTRSRPLVEIDPDEGVGIGIGGKARCGGRGLGPACPVLPHPAHELGVPLGLCRIVVAQEQHLQHRAARLHDARRGRAHHHAGSRLERAGGREVILSLD